jgi:hypothetical protein
MAKEITKSVNWKKADFNFQRIREETSNMLDSKFLKSEQKKVEEGTEVKRQVRDEPNEAQRRLQKDFDFYKISNEIAETFENGKGLRDFRKGDDEHTEAGLTGLGTFVEEEEVISLEDFPFEMSSLVSTDYTCHNMEIFSPWLISLLSFQKAPADKYYGTF